MSLLVNKLRLGKKLSTSNSFHHKSDNIILPLKQQPLSVSSSTDSSASASSNISTNDCNNDTTTSSSSSDHRLIQHPTSHSDLLVSHNHQLPTTNTTQISSTDTLPSPQHPNSLQYYANYVQQTTNTPSSPPPPPHIHKHQLPTTTTTTTTNNILTSSSRGSTATTPGPNPPPISMVSSSYTDFDSPLVPEWGKLIPLLPHIHPTISLNREKFIIGRHFSCHCRFNLSEISSKHVFLWRERRKSDGLWQVLIDDQSTNGSFLNNRSIGKNQRMVVRHNDELAFGRKFTGRRHVPEIGAFLDWMFIGTSQAQEFRSDIDRAKQIASFHVLVTMSDTELESFGIRNEHIREKIMVSVSNWKHDHRFPAYRVELNDAHLYAPGDLNLITTANMYNSNSTVIPNSASPIVGAPAVQHMIDHSPYMPHANIIPVSRDTGCSESQQSLVAAVADQDVLASVMAKLVKMYPKTNLDTIAVVTKYEQLIAGNSLCAEEWEVRAAVKLAEIVQRNTTTTTTTFCHNSKPASSYHESISSSLNNYTTMGHTSIPGSSNHESISSSLNNCAPPSMPPKLHGPLSGPQLPGHPTYAQVLHAQGNNPGIQDNPNAYNPLQSIPASQQQFLAQIAMAQMAMFMPLFQQQQQQLNSDSMWQQPMQLNIPVHMHPPDTPTYTTAFRNPSAGVSGGGVPPQYYQYPISGGGNEIHPSTTNNNTRPPMFHAPPVMTVAQQFAAMHINPDGSPVQVPGGGMFHQQMMPRELSKQSLHSSGSVAGNSLDRGHGL